MQEQTHPIVRRFLFIVAAFLVFGSFASAGDWTARTDGSVLTPTGQVLPPGNPWGNRSVARAIQLAEQGDRVLIDGDHYEAGTCPTLSLGEKAQGFGVYVAAPKRGIEIVGINGGRIGHVIVYQRYGAIEGFLWRDLNIVAAQFGFLFAKNVEHVDHTFQRVIVEEMPGPGLTDWAWRVNGPSASFEWDQCQTDGLDEHAVYADNMLGGVIRDCTFTNCRRTGIQVVNRRESGRSGGLDLVIEGNTITDCGEHGAASITIAGHLGRVVLKRNEVRSRWDTYALLIWNEGANKAKGKLGAYVDENGFATPIVHLYPRNVFDVPNTQRGNVAIGSVGELVIAQQTWGVTPKPDLWLDQIGPDGKRPTNGTVGDVRFWGESPSSWTSWSGGTKVRFGRDDWTDADIDARAWVR